MTIHVVQTGESTGSIAAHYGVDPARLAADNQVPAGGALAVGQTLVVRFPQQVHAVQPGETLFSIAAGYGVSIRRLWRNNWSLGGRETIFPGQDLVPIPPSPRTSWPSSCPISATSRLLPMASAPTDLCCHWRMTPFWPPPVCGEPLRCSTCPP